MIKNISSKKNKKPSIIKTLIENTPIAYIILDEDFNIHYINKSFLDLRKLDLQTTIGEKCYNISNNGIPCKDCAIRVSLETGKKHLVSRKDILKNNTIRYIDDYAFPLKKKLNGKKLVLEIMIDRSAELNARNKLWQKYEEILKYLLNIIEIKDEYTATHSQNVQELSLKIGRYLNLTEEELFILSLSSILHDIGKVKVPFSILTKPGRLTDDEYEEIKRHSIYSSEILDNLDSFREIKKYVMHHHERPDGRGYPHGLKGDEIPFFSRIIAVSDSYDAMVSRRCYKNSLTEEYALSEIERGIGTQFDKNIATAFLNLKREEKYGLLDEPSRPYVERILDKTIIESSKKEIHSLDNILDTDLINQIWESTPCSYALINKENRIVIANEQIKTLLGLDMTYLTGRKYYTVIHLENIHMNEDIIQLAFTKNTTQTTRFVYTVENCTKYISAIAIPYKEDPQNSAVILVLLDRTKEESMKRQLKTDFNNLTEKLTDLVSAMHKHMEKNQMSCYIEETQEKTAQLKKLQEEIRDMKYLSSANIL